MSKGFIEVTLYGCDDSTVIKIPAEHVSPHEWRRLRLLAYVSRRTSEYSCQPQMYVVWRGEEEDE